MEILVYSQQGNMGGSTRLLLNLARHLAREHSVSVAFASHHSPQASDILLARFPELRLIPGDAQTMRRRRFDVAILHLPFAMEDVDNFKAARKIAVLMELVERHPIALREEHCAQFERILHLHREQVRHLSPASRAAKCTQLPVIDNIDFEPEYVPACCIGAIGGAHKMQLPLALSLLDALPQRYSMCFWSPDPLAIDGLALPLLDQALRLVSAGRLRQQSPSGDIRLLSQRYRALLHTPLHGNGTSVVVSDALSCGKLAILAPLPAYREAYGHLDGVLFTDQPGTELAGRICAYSREDFSRIRAAYRAHHDRSDILRLWSAAILDGDFHPALAPGREPELATTDAASAAAPRVMCATVNPHTRAPSMSEAPSRNAPCPCGSGKRYKHCCGAAAQSTPVAAQAPVPEVTTEQLNLRLAHSIESYNRFDFRLAASLCDSVLASDAATALQRLAAAEIGGAACTRLDRHARARELYLVALSIDPDRVQTLHNLGLNAIHLGDFALAIEYANRLLSVEPGNTNAYNTMTNALRELGRWHEAKELYARLIADGREDETVYNSYLMSLHYTPMDPEEAYRAHIGWAERYAPAANMAARVHHNDRSTDRKLRLGYFSPNFSRKIAGYFIRPLIAHHDRTRFDLYLYSNTAVEDDYTDYFRDNCSKWTDVRGLDAKQVAQAIVDDRIDVMVDLAGHAPDNILAALSYKPAPVQITMLDYFDTTGVSAMDYFVSDDYHSPVGSPQRFVEKLLRLSTIRLCYEPVDLAPPVRELPAARNGYITFGSFNRRQKVTPEVIGLWSRVLHDVPGSRLVLKGSYFDQAAVQADILHHFCAEGIDAARIEFRGRSHHREALEQYGDVDIGLDTFPWNGGLTTCESLLMGVPVIALAGDRIISRQSAAMMHALGLDDFVADDRDQYVDIARRWSASTGALEQLRRELRQRLLASPLGDGKRYAAAVEQIYASTWRAWCEGAQPGGRTTS
ncbi:MAG TPA: SEC-C metal-binding domain-containing protein [Pseudomonadales bacterium]|nr:SEC-C metal-binding domain-containing protein [Pseudomonadales bacterium]